MRAPEPVMSRFPSSISSTRMNNSRRLLSSLHGSFFSHKTYGLKISGPGYMLEIRDKNGTKIFRLFHEKEIK
jgi:hypothetical protein